VDMLELDAPVHERTEQKQATKAKWDQMCAEEKAPFQEKEAESKVTYQRDRTAYEAAGGDDARDNKDDRGFGGPPAVGPPAVTHGTTQNLNRYLRPADERTSTPCQGGVLAARTMMRTW